MDGTIHYIQGQCRIAPNAERLQKRRVGNNMVPHTPGPWVSHEQGNANEYCLLTNSKRWVIGFLQNGELMIPEQRANARLIASSPDLLIALERVTVFIESAGLIPPCVREARKVIAQAKGEE